MTDSGSLSFFPKKLQILSGSSLKMIAVVTMLIDHIGAYYLRRQAFASAPLFTVMGKAFSLYQISRDIGRIAFPIFVFLIVEGFQHTHSRINYARNLFLFALISELPWNYAHTGTLRYEKQNVYFTLLLGYLGMWAIEYFWENHIAQLLCLFILFVISYYLKADYGWKGYIFCLIMYLLRNERAAQAIVGSCWLHYEWKACFAYLPINMYNGKRGFLSGKTALKYAFYAFYPVHILILGLIKYNVIHLP